jgi:hypothetical protein
MDPIALARLLMSSSQPQTAGTAFEPVTRQQQLQNYRQMEGQDAAWQSAEGSPWKTPEPGMLAKLLMHPVTQGVMPAVNFMGRTGGARVGQMPANVPNMMPQPPRSLAQHYINSMTRSGEFPPTANDAMMGVVR